MEIILEIPPQSSTHQIPRLAKVIQVFENGGVLLEGRDGHKPAQFRLQPRDSFPWLLFFQKVCVAWELSSLQAIPYEYRPLRRIPQEIVDIIPKVNEKEALKIIETLRTKGFLPKLPKFAK